MQIFLYAAAMTEAIASGQVGEMRRLAAEAETHLAQYGDIPSLLALLKVEIAKLEGGKA